MQDKLIPLCRLYENTSKTTGKRYFVGNLSFTAKLLLLRNDEAKEGEPQWTLFLAEREQKPHASTVQAGEIPDAQLACHAETSSGRAGAGWSVEASDSGCRRGRAADRRGARAAPRCSSGSARASGSCGRRRRGARA